MVARPGALLNVAYTLCDGNSLPLPSVSGPADQISSASPVGQRCRYRGECRAK